jgi:hypothetical protein
MAAVALLCSQKPLCLVIEDSWCEIRGIVQACAAFSHRFSCRRVTPGDSHVCRVHVRLLTCEVWDVLRVQLVVNVYPLGLECFRL